MSYYDDLIMLALSDGGDEKEWNSGKMVLTLDQGSRIE